MFTCRQQKPQIANCLFDFLVTVIFIWWKKLFHPCEMEVLFCETSSQRDGVWHSECHVTVKHEWETIPYQAACLLAKRHILFHSLHAIGWSIGTRN